MSGALDGLRFNADSLRRNRFCIGVKRGREYRCGGEADENAINNAIDLLIEAIKRLIHWRVWDSWWIEEAMDEWLMARDRLEVQLRGKYSEEVINDLLGLVDKFIGYNEQFLNYWRDVGSEVMRLVDDLINGRAKVVIWSNEDGISMHGEFIKLETHKTSTSSVMVQLKLKGLKGVTIRVSDVFRRAMSGEEYGRFINDVLMALEGGFEEADGFVEDGYAAMGTTQIWQAIVWTLLYPGRARVHIDNVNVDDSNVTITWSLRTSNEALKGKILSNADKLSDEGLLAFMLGAVLGDGWADVVKLVINGRGYDEAVVEITMADEEFERWVPLFERLRKIGFKSSKPSLVNGYEVMVRFYGSNAINLARAMINVLPPILKDILGALSFEKWNNLRRIAEMEVKYRRGEMQVDVAGYKFTVSVRGTPLY
ncbi:hypothetical protein [Vulcanisaeta sp. JCM 14467]